MIKIMMCDDQVMFRDLLLELLQKNEAFKIINRSSSGEECIDQIEKGFVPDILLLDISMPKGISGYTVAKYLQKKHPKIKVIAVSMLTEINAIKAMIRFGAKGFIYKESKPSEISKAIRAVFNEQEYYPENFTLTKDEIIIYKNTKIDWLEKMSKSELYTVKLIAEDFSIKQVSSELNISASVVNKKMTSLFKKTQTHTRTGLITFLRKVGILE